MASICFLLCPKVGFLIMVSVSTSVQKLAYLLPFLDLLKHLLVSALRRKKRKISLHQFSKNLIIGLVQSLLEARLS